MTRPVDFFSFTLSLGTFKKFSDDEKREYFLKATPNAIEATITKILPVAPKLLLPYSKWVKWNMHDVLDLLNNQSVIMELVSKDKLTQDSIDYKFRNTKKIGIVKALFPEVSYDNSIKTITVVKLLDIFKGDNQQPIYTVLRNMEKQGILDWEILNGPLFRKKAEHLWTNYDAYKSFFKFLISDNRFEVENAATEQKIWVSSFDTKKILLEKDGYKFKMLPKHLLEEGMIVEYFPQWGKVKSEKFIELVNAHKSLANYIVENELVELYPQSARDIFIF